MFTESSVKIMPFLLLLLLAITSWWINNLVTTSAPAVKRELRHDPDYVMQGLETTVMDETGNVRHTMTASKLTHFPDDDSTVIDAPFIRVFEQTVEIWNIRSQRGITSGAGKEVFLQGEVDIDRLGDARQGAARITTSNLQIFADRDYAETKERITITDKTGTTTAIGMRLWMEEQKLHLLSEVRGQYETN